MKRAAFSVFVALLCATAQAAVGLAELAGLEGDGPLTLFYPAAGTPQSVRRGPFTVSVVQKAVPVRGNGRLVVISHGSGGSPWTYTDLAVALVEAGFVVAFPEHRGDNFRDRSEIGPPSWKRRPGEVSRAIDAVLRDVRFAPLVAADRIGLYGMSAGGHTALSFAGGLWAPAGLARHCETHIREDFGACVAPGMQLKGDFFDTWRIWSTLWVIRWRYSDAVPQTHRDARVRAIVAAVPYAADFDMASLASPPVPLGLVRAGQDKWLLPRFHSDAVLKACKTCERVADVTTGGHGALLSPLPPSLPEAVAGLLGDPPGFDRSVLPAVDRNIVAFFRKHLLP